MKTLEDAKEINILVNNKKLRENESRVIHSMWRYPEITATSDTPYNILYSVHGLFILEKLKLFLQQWHRNYGAQCHDYNVCNIDKINWNEINYFHSGIGNVLCKESSMFKY
jgi:hypothetical protein